MDKHSEGNVVNTLDLHRNGLKLVSILVASDLDDKGLLQAPQLFFTEVNTHTHLIPGVRENEEKPNGEKRETEGPAVASHQGMNQQNTVIVEAPQYGKS